MNLRKPFFRYLVTVPLYDLAAWGIVVQPWSERLRAALLPLLIGGLFLLGLIGGVVWGGLPGLRWRTVFAYTAVSLLIFPFPYIFWGIETAEFWFFLLLFNGQQAMGFALGAWCRMHD